MTSPALSTAQVRVLMAARKATDEGRAITPPLGPSSRPFRFLKDAQMLEIRPTDLPHAYWLTEKGRQALERVLHGP